MKHIKKWIADLALVVLMTATVAALPAAAAETAAVQVQRGGIGQRPLNTWPRRWA